MGSAFARVGFIFLGGSMLNFARLFSLVFLSGAIAAQAQYSGQLFGPINVDDGSGVSGLSATSQAPTTNGQIRYQWRVTPTTSGNDRWLGFEWNSRTRVFAFYGNPTFTLTDDVQISGSMDIGGSAYGWGNPGNTRFNGVESTKQIIFNITDSGSTLDPAPGNDVIQFSVTEISHSSSLASLNDGNTSGMAVARSGNTMTLSGTNTAESSGSNEEIWYQWTHDGFTTRNFIRDTNITANESVALSLSSTAPILREGDTLQWLRALTGPSATATVSATTGGTLNFDIIAISKSRVVSTGVIADDDTAAPVPSAFSVANQTDGAIVSGGYTISGTLTDADSGINNAGATVSGNDFSPNFDILNNANTQLASDQLFTTRPADGANGTVSASAPAIAAGTSIDLGTYKIRVSATDNDEDPSTAANDRTALVDNQVTTFTVTDDDTSGPVHSSFTGNAITLSGANYLDTDLASGLAIAGQVQDAQSGVSAGGASSRYGLARDGVGAASGSFNTLFTDGQGVGSPVSINVTIPNAIVQVVGTYTLYVTNFNYDVDRGSADRESTVNTYTFTVYANTPTITVQAGTLAFGNQVVNTTSSEQSYTVSGINLGADPIVITAPSGFQVSTTSGSGFGSSVNLTPSGGTVNNTTIYARFVPNNVAGFSANITHTHTSASTQNKAVTGTGTAPNDPAAFSATGGSLQNTLTFTLNAQSKPVTIVRNTDNNFTTPSGAPPSAGNAFAGGTVVYNGSSSPQTDTGLAAGTLYYYRAFSYDNVNGNFYSAGLSASATTIPAAPTTLAASSVDFISFTANWNASSGATSYRLDVSPYSDFSALLSGYNNLTVAGTSQAVSIPGTDNKVGQYYYRVRAVNGSGTSGNSDIRAVGTAIPDGVNGGGTPPAATVVAPSTLYVGDTGTFAVKAWGTLNGNFAAHRVVIDTDADIIAGGIRGSFTGFDNVEYSSATSPQFTSAGTWYWGMQFDYGSPYGTNIWMVRNNADWAGMYYRGTNANLTVTVTALDDPTGISIAQDGTFPAERIDLAWSKWNNRNVMIVRSLDNVFTAPTPGQTYTVGNTIGGDTVVYNSGGTSFEDQNLSASTLYYYRLYSENFGYYSGGAVVSQTTAAAPAPSAPVATAASGVGYTSFTANWNASAGATSYRIDVSRNAAFTDLVVSDHNPGNVTSYAVSGYGTGHYYYRVRAVNGGGTSDNSNVIEIGTQTAQSRNTGGGSPQVTGGTIYVGDTVTFGLDSWETMPGNNFGRARVWTHTTASLGSGTAGAWGDYVNTLNRTRTRQMTAAGTIYWGIQLDYGSPYGTNFWYVRDSSAYYNMHFAPTGATLTVTVTALGNPTGVSAAQNGGSPGTAIDLAWTKWNSRDVMVVRSTDASFGTPNPGQVYAANDTISGDLVVYKGSGTSFTDTGLGNGTTYYYRYYSENFGYYSAGTDANATTAGSAPAAPADQAATVVNTTSFQANWSASAGATGYRLDVSTVINFGSFVSGFNNLDVGNVTAYSVSGLTAGNTYYYRVRAYNGGGTSGNSGTRTVTLPATANVSIQSITETGPTSGDISFLATVGASYDVYYSDNGGTSWQFLSTVTADTNPDTVSVTENDYRLFKIVIAGANAGASPSTPHGVVEPTVPTGYSMNSAPLDLADLTLLGDFGDMLKDGLANGSQVLFLEANGTFTTRTLSGGNWNSDYTLAEGQGFFINNAGAPFAPRFTGPVGSIGSATRTINPGASPTTGRWNILGLLQGTPRTFAQVFATGNFTGTPTANWNQNFADVIAIDQGGGVFKRIFRAGNGTWVDASTLTPYNATLQPGTAVYYFRYGNGTLSITF